MMKDVGAVILAYSDMHTFHHTNFHHFHVMNSKQKWNISWTIMSHVCQSMIQHSWNWKQNHSNISVIYFRRHRNIQEFDDHKWS